jgi:putative phage-type endonuclease
MKQNTQEWLDFRRNKIGASDASAIMGVNPWKTRYQLYEEKIYGKTQEQTGAMRRGSYYEEEARNAFEKLTGLSVKPKIIVSNERDWQMASLDGLSFDGTVFTEIKVPNKESHELAKSGIIADYYNIQMQHQYATSTKLEKGFYFSYLPDQKEGIVVEIKKDDLLIEQLLEEEEKFYELMLNKTPPPLSERDYAMKDDANWNDAANEWLELSRYIDSLVEKKEGLRDQLITLADGHSSKGSGIRVTRSMSKGLINYKNIPELFGVDLEAYRGSPNEKWTVAACK